MKTAAALLIVVCAFPALIFGQAVVFDYSKLYEAISPAVVQITTDDGSGSGFLITPFGHIATNYHVIRNSRYLAVQFPDGRKVRAVVAAANPHYDMAVLKVNSAVVEGIQPLRVMAEDQEATVKVGIPVVAIGSPLNQKFLMTQGILSKVEETTVLGDFLLQSGNSGGPLVNTDGIVLAVNTFGEGTIGGAIRVGALREFLSSPELLAESIFTEPAPEQLRSVSSVRYPVDVLNQKIQAEPLEIDAYKLKAGDFLITAITPVLIAKLQSPHDKRRTPHGEPRQGNQRPDSNAGEEPYYEWHRATEQSLDFAVTFDVRPASGPVKRSVAWHIIPPPLRFGKAGQTELEFKADFLEFRIYRDGELLDPIMPGRMVVQGRTDRKNHRFVDYAYAGSYVYSPEDFLTGNEFRIQVIDTRTPDLVHKELILTVDSKLIKQLRSDFTFVPGMLITRAP